MQNVSLQLPIQHLPIVGDQSSRPCIMEFLLLTPGKMCLLLCQGDQYPGFPRMEGTPWIQNFQCKNKDSPRQTGTSRSSHRNPRLLSKKDPSHMAVPKASEDLVGVIFFAR